MSPSKKANRQNAKSRNQVDAVNKERTSIQEQKKSGIGVFILRVLALTVVIGITVYIFSIRDHVQDFAGYGYPGIFLVMLLANATVIIPAPGVAVVFAMGNIFNPFWVALAAGTGGAIGELSGYLAGFSGQALVENTRAYNRVAPWVQKYGAWAILTLSAFPNPFFDLAGIAAGVAKIPVWKFLLFCWIGQIIKMGLFAFAGAYSIDWIANFFQ
ncbi:VTT domain-containing protein [Candidatus Villigracilis saccharophilus]|uniref:VTT domain-containing protein n=1 Tax=Candidatus Villigracilis saccharophilus TaxID=3140684 RepID=UPI003134880B|nr:VTT domain-containing protein [Anaerolineales bacterium]